VITSTGKDFDPFNPNPADIDIEDIARGLSRTCRFAGQLREGREFYSVAQHSVIMTRWAKLNNVPWKYQYSLLLHDASEAYLNDLVTEIKQKILVYQELEAKVQDIILYKFTGTANRYNVTTKYDTWMLQIEAMFLMSRQIVTPKIDIWPLPDSGPIYPFLAVQELWYPNKSYDEFMKLWKELNE